LKLRDKHEIRVVNEIEMYATPMQGQILKADEVIGCFGMEYFKDVGE
jgi:hypothetical protein